MRPSPFPTHLLTSLSPCDDDSALTSGWSCGQRAQPYLPSVLLLAEHRLVRRREPLSRSAGACIGVMRSFVDCRPSGVVLSRFSPLGTCCFAWFQLRSDDLCSYRFRLPARKSFLTPRLCQTPCVLRFRRWFVILLSPGPDIPNRELECWRLAVAQVSFEWTRRHCRMSPNNKTGTFRTILAFSGTRLCVVCIPCVFERLATTRVAEHSEA